MMTLAPNKVSQSGYTITELITVMVIIGIIAAAALPRFFDRNTFDSRGFYDQTIATLRYAQKTAIAQRRSVCVAFAANSMTLSLDTIHLDVAHPVANCPGVNIADPSGKSSYILTAPSGVSLAGTDFSFDSLGRSNISVAPIAVDSYTITIHQATGYVR